MKANNFPNAPKPTPKEPTIKSRIKNGRCVNTDKIPYYKKKAEARAAKLSADERGEWSAYKCPYGNRHWHIGHTPSKPLKNYTDQKWLDEVNDLLATDSKPSTGNSDAPSSNPSTAPKRKAK